MKKIKLQIKNRWTGSILFEYESENNTIATTVTEAIKAKANLSYASLRSANLSYAELSSANLRSADLSSASLRSANLSYAELSYANLSYANLRSADLSSADLSYASLRSADLSYAELRSANLRYAELRSANLRSADLSYAELRSANLRSAELSSAVNAEQAIAQTRICADGDIIGWKKCQNGIIVKLLIPAAAKRSNAFGRKCRAEYANVLEVIGAEIAVSSHDNKTTYKAGEAIRPDKWDEDFTNECSSGIHFFITRTEAENYN